MICKVGIRRAGTHRASRDAQGEPRNLGGAHLAPGQLSVMIALFTEKEGESRAEPPCGKPPASPPAVMDGPRAQYE